MTKEQCQSCKLYHVYYTGEKDCLKCLGQKKNIYLMSNLNCPYYSKIVRFELGDLELHATRNIIDTETGKEFEVVTACSLLNDLTEILDEISYYFRDDVTLRDLDDKDFETLQRLCKKSEEII